MTTTEIAKIAGVSQATVSRVLNGNGNVSIKKRESVLKALNKVKTKHHKFSVFQESKTIGLLMLIPIFDPEKYNSIAENLPENYSLFLIPGTVKVSELRRIFNSKKISGLLVNGPRCQNQELMDYLDEVPSAWLNSHNEHEQSTVFTGNEAAGRLAARYLMDQGCKKLGIIDLKSYNPSYAVRFEGFRYEAFAKERDVSVSVCSEAEKPFEELTDAEIEKDISEVALSNQLLECDGIFCPDDRVTAILYKVFQKNCIPIKGERKIISCNNDSQYLTGLYPRPATIDLAAGLTAKLALKKLIKQINNNILEDKMTILVRPELIPGE